MVTSLFLAAWLLAGREPQAPGLTPQAPLAEPVVSIWYRGTGGVPKPDDLAVIRAHGFTAITWPAGQAAHAAELHRLAGTLGLGVSIQTAPVPLGPDAASRPGDRVDVVVSRATAAEIPALVWRAVAHGARTIAFDPGTSSGSGLTDANGRPLPASRRYAVYAPLVPYCSITLGLAVQPLLNALIRMVKSPTTNPPSGHTMSLSVGSPPLKV